MGQHKCSCGREFKCAETLRRHGAITGHPQVTPAAVADLDTAPKSTPKVKAQPAPEAPVRDTLEQSIAWAMQVIAKKRAEQELYERELRHRAARPIAPPPQGFWSKVFNWVGLAA